MTTFFKLGCLPQGIMDKIIILFSIIGLILGIAHGGYSVCTSNFLSHYLDYVNGSLATLNLLDTYEQYKKLLDSPLKYFAVAGIQQIATSVIFIIVILTKINKNMQIWSRVLTILLVLNLAFNFVIAVLSSMSLIYFNELFKNQIKTLNSLTLGHLHIEEYILWIDRTLKYVQAEALITFTVNLPMIAFTFIVLIQNCFRTEYVETQNLNQQRTVQNMNQQRTVQIIKVQTHQK